MINKILRISLVGFSFAVMLFLPPPTYGAGTPMSEQSIPTNRGFDWESFTIGTDTFLAVANSTNFITNNIDSKIYKWDGSAFVQYQSILTHAAHDWESFTIGTDTFLAVANFGNDSTNNIDSKIYRWDGSGFVEYQSIPMVHQTGRALPSALTPS
jgi:hypothetical protein